MRSRFPSASGISYSFGPGPLTPAIKALIIANVVVFVMQWLLQRTGDLNDVLGLTPREVLGGSVWQPFTYMFLHAGIGHISLQHAGALDVRRRTGTDVGHDGLH